VPANALESVLRARHALSLGRLEEAQVLARRALGEEPDAAEALHILGVVDLRREQPQAAETALRRAIALDASVAVFHNDLGNALQDRGRLKEAIAAYRRALRLHPALADAWNDLGTARFANGEFEAAIECYRSAIRLRPDHTAAYANLGAVYRKLGLLAQARRALQRELALRLGQGARALARRVLHPGGSLDLGSAQQLAALARAQLDAGNPRHAEQIALRAAALQGDHAAAYSALVEARLRQGRVPEALDAARAAHHAKPADPLLREQLARALAAAGNLDEAAAAYEAVIAVRPRSALALAQLGELHLRRGDGQGAEPLLRRALELQPLDPGLHVALGEARYRQQAAAEAETAYRRALEIEPRHFVGHIRLSELLRETGRFDEAEAVARKTLEIEPDSPLAHFAVGMAHKAKTRLAPAIECFERALQLDPKQVQAMQQLAHVLRESERMEEAEKHLRAAARLRPLDPLLQADLGVVLADQMRYDEALACFDRTIELAPQKAIGLNRKSLLLDLLGRRAEALEMLHEALRLAPADHSVRYNIGLHHLKYGEHAPGWEGYEYRRKFDSFIGRHRRFPLPEWDGAPLDGRTLLVCPEQGLGDEIMFGSCLPEVAARAGHVIVECDQKLEALFRRSFPGCTVVSRQRTLENDWVQRIRPKPDLQVAAGSLASHFRRHAADFPQQGGFLQADAAKVERWRARVAALGPGRRIGLSWRGGVGYTGKTRRSLSLEQLLPVLQLPGIRFVSLQYTDVRDETRELEARRGIKVHHWQEAIDDYDETAALVCALDSVLTVCTAIVHLSGALGRPALVMVPFGADWRYGAFGERMVWYPSVRLLRQQRLGDWSDVLREVAARIVAPPGA
jgi:tetratricopeptide (TPR) repeat protein